MYQALYRKYRPRTFEDVVEQRGVTQTLKAQLQSGKLSHAYLFTGTRGTGKTTCAKILAKAVNCLDLQDGNPCNACTACRAIDSGSCVDVMEIDAASNNSVDQIRDLRDEAVYTPAQVQRRVYIIDEVHMLSTAAFNALLKIMEEPPSHLLFILATTELHKVPATILSRCQRFSFRRLRSGDVAARLNYIAYQEGIELQPEAAELLASMADGALRDAVSLLDQCASVGAVTEESVCETLGLAGSRNTVQILDAMADGDAVRALTLFSELYEAGKDLSAFLGELSLLARDLLVLKTAPKTGAELVTGVSTPTERAALLEKLSPAQLLRITTVLQRTAANFYGGANRRLEVELCLMELCEPSLATDAQALSARIGKLEEAFASGIPAAKSAAKKPKAEEPPTEQPEQPKPERAPAEEPAPQKPAQPQKPTNGLPDNFWPELCARVAGEIPQPLRGLLNARAEMRTVRQGDTVYLETDNAFLEKIVTSDVLQLLSRKASFLLGDEVRVQIGKAKRGGNAADPLEDLLRFGKQHNDIIKIEE
ncbi:MAG: DNA polymerase III subunit gamma/tau [Oscillospiraceae bacterium]|nr:DNA polymerase III subunit gamma/tau [Oscillospiraceae bacterium]